MSVNDVNLLCRKIKGSSTARGSLNQRQQRIAELFEALHNVKGDKPAVPKNPDDRPLKSYYNKIVPACASETVLAIASQDLPLRKNDCQAHEKAYQIRFLAAIFPEEGAGEKITSYKSVLEASSLDFSLEVLEKFSNSPTALKANAGNLIRDMAYPLARRLRNRRAKVDVQIRFYNLIIQCIHKEPSISEELDRHLIRCAIQAWKRSRRGKDAMDNILGTLIGFQPEKNEFSLKAYDGIAEELRHVGPGQRFDLLQLFLQNVKSLKIHIDFSHPNNENVRSLTQLWNPELFFQLPKAISIRLFDYLRNLHPDGKFVNILPLSRGTSGKKNYCDLDILFAWLHSREHGRHLSAGAWLEHTIKNLEERKDKAVLARDRYLRARLIRSILDLSTASGSLDLYADTTLWTNRHAFIFFDHLGKIRNETYKEHRLSMHPAIATLQAPWPKGLPIQSLSPIIGRNMPYLESRAREIVFAPASIVLAPLPNDKDTLHIVDKFVDNYKFAVRVFVAGSGEGPERENRVLLAWNHAVTELTGNLMSREESLWCWKHVFESIEDVSLPGTIAEIFRVKDIELPECSGSEDPVEWNPSPVLANFPSSIISAKSRALPKTCLGVMLGSDGILSSQNVRTVEVELPQSTWDFYTSKTMLTPSNRDALIAAVTAFINAKYGTMESPFMHPCPSPDDVRFPAFRLAEEFLERESRPDHSLDSALKLLAKLSAYTPVQLPFHLMRSLNRPKKEASGAMVEITNQISRGDQAWNACQNIRFFVKCNKSSQRHPLSIKFLNHYPAITVKELFSDLSSNIQDELQKQKEMKLKTGKGKKPSTPSVSVRTVRIIAQMLCGGKYLNQEFACNILLQLLKSAPRTDMKISIAKSLLSISSGTESAALRLLVIDILEEYIVPKAASINAHLPTSEKKWVDAEARDCPLPKVHASKRTWRLPPIQKLLVNATPTILRRKEEAGRPSREAWMKRVILPMIEGSASNHRRWMSLFLKRNGFELSSDSLPLVPLRPKLLLHLLRTNNEFYPASTFKTVKDLSMIMIDPPESIRAINQAIKNDSTLFRSEAGTHWLSVWSNTNAHPWSFGITQSADLLLDIKTNTLEQGLGGANVVSIQQFLREVAESYLARSDTTSYGDFTNYLSFFGRINSLQDYNYWQTNCLPLLEGFISRINSLRTPEWQRDPDRWPSKLPETLPIKLQIFKARCWRSSSRRLSKADVETYANNVTLLLQDITKTDEPYHNSWSSLKSTVLDTFQRMHFVQLSLKFGSLNRCHSPNLTLVDHPNIELADTLITEADDPCDLPFVTRMREMLGSWESCHNEVVRKRAETIWAMLKDPDEQPGWYECY
ncbi:hypothetical protein F5B20DRAFT_586887 [Whalleya microplaca]|nr:hypothetical protein F5B20DRAFT_586887 [Whalleya microplaca]